MFFADVEYGKRKPRLTVEVTLVADYIVLLLHERNEDFLCCCFSAGTGNCDFYKMRKFFHIGTCSFLECGESIVDGDKSNTVVFLIKIYKITAV